MVQLARKLVCALGLVLILPPGWCCMLGATRLAAEGKGQQGCCCKSHPNRTVPAPQTPTPFKDCCCADRNTTPPAQPELPTPEAVLVATLPAEVLSAASLFEAGCGTVTIPRAGSLHVWNCVWLC